MTNLLLLCRSFQKKRKRVGTAELQQPLCVGRVTKPGSLRGCCKRQSPPRDSPGEYRRSRSEVLQKNSGMAGYWNKSSCTSILKSWSWEYTPENHRLGTRELTFSWSSHHESTLRWNHTWSKHEIRKKNYCTNYCIIVRTIVLFPWLIGQKWWCNCGRWDESRQ